jgi:hypothetical protein
MDRQLNKSSEESEITRNSGNCWVFGLCLSPGILETTEHKVSETESVSVLR